MTYSFLREIFGQRLCAEIAADVLQSVAPNFTGTSPFFFRSTDWVDLIVDVHIKITTVEVPILCTLG
jgi:hypothetical protein